MRDIRRDIAPLLGVLLPAIAAFFMYRRSERDREKEIADAAKFGPFNLAGMILTKGNAALYIEELKDLTHGLGKVAATGVRIAEQLKAGEEQWSRLIDEMRNLRRAVEDKRKP